MKNLRKARLSSLVVLVWASHQFALHGVEFEPEVGGALEACSSLDQFTKWISELSGETESSVRGKAFWILTRYVYSEDVLTAEEYLREQFYRMGLVTERQPGYPDASNNLIARLPGASRPEGHGQGGQGRKVIPESRLRRERSGSRRAHWALGPKATPPAGSWTDFYTGITGSHSGNVCVSRSAKRSEGEPAARGVGCAFCCGLAVRQC